MDYYLVTWPCDVAPFNAAFSAIAPVNVLSVNINAAGDQAVIKAPSGVQSDAVLQMFDAPPTDLVSSAGWVVHN